MPLRSAYEIAWDKLPRCPVCDVGISATGRHQPIAVDNDGKPYCRLHGHIAEPDYDRWLAEYERRRKAQSELLKDAEKHGVSPTKEELDVVRSQWNQV